MAIDSGFAPLLEAMAPVAGLDWSTTPASELRAIADNPLDQGEPQAMARVEDLAIPVEGTTIAARLYVPEGVGEAPALTVYYHGGGWVLGTLETHDATCRLLARDAACAVLSVSYRLAPEHRYPTAAEDAFAALRWAADNAARLGCDSARLGVAGDSAGGNLAAAVALMARDRGGPQLAHQLLLYPVTDHGFDTPSYAAHGGPGGFLTTAAMRRFWGDYLGETAPEDAPLAALLRRDDLAGVAPATVIVAEHDPLRDEGIAYAERLRVAGVAVELIDAEGMIHGFAGMTHIVPAAAGFTRRAADRFKEALR